MKKNLSSEIVRNAEKIPLECQEKVLDVIKAMVYTRKVVERNMKKELDKK